MSRIIIYIFLFFVCSFGQITAALAQKDAIDSEYTDVDYDESAIDNEEVDTSYNFLDEREINEDEQWAIDSLIEAKSEGATIKDSSKISTIVSFSKDFKSQYSSEDYLYDFEVKEQSLWSKFKQWLIQQLMRIFNMESAIQAGKVFDLVYYIFIGLLIAFLIYFLVKVLLFKDKRWFFKKSKKEFDEPMMDMEEALKVSNYEALIQQLTSDGNYRDAIRYYYAWTLKGMIDKELVEFSPDKTSMDYINEIKDLKLKKDFEYASYLFDYIWYGEFSITATQYQRASAQFIAIIKR